MKKKPKMPKALKKFFADTGRKGGRSTSKKKLAALKANRAKRWPKKGAS